MSLGFGSGLSLGSGYGWSLGCRLRGLHVPDPKPERDAFIATTALVHGMTIVTRNVSDFKLTGVEVLNPWEW